MSFISKNSALGALIQNNLNRLAADEQLSPDRMLNGLENGEMVLLGNPLHPNLRPVPVGQPGRVKVNANLGTSPGNNNLESELCKLKTALLSGADTVMDLSIAGNLNEIRKQIISTCPCPLGTVPIYAVAQRYIEQGEDPAGFQPEELLEEIRLQAEQGVDFMTLHCGITRANAAMAEEKNRRCMGIVSRGGSILARWMKRNNQGNPLLSHFEEILEICRAYNVTISMGDGMRPGAGADAGDAAQWDEMLVISGLISRARQAGVQCMVEGPGHVPLHLVPSQIHTAKTLTHGAPLYVLGPLTIDSSPGYDHIAGAIGAALAVQAGADFLCYLTPAEHLGLPGVEDVRQGVIASRIAAQAGETALRRPWALHREKAMNQARSALDWQGMKKAALDPAAVCERKQNLDADSPCDMCGGFCALKMTRDF
ncbi:MAG: phosphomethylpyrimidine synthase ThiC [Desulfovibrionaceae bacterium]|nr:phosphomethylpyrimidine synthase ThiC [Desulfovibrionaceae bacterium]